MAFRWLTRVLAAIGAGIHGSAAIAAADLAALQQDAYDERPDLKLSAADAAAAAVKEIDTSINLTQEARLAGLDGAHFQALVDLAYNAPGPAELLDMLRRGFINDSAFQKGLARSFVHPDYRQAFTDSQRVPIPLGEAVQAVVQSQMSEDEGAAIAAEYGITPEGFDLLFRTAGNPPGPMQVLTLFRRGVLTDAQVDQALRESRLKNKYIEQFKALAVNYPPLFQLSRLLKAGTLTPELATEILNKEGYAPDLVAAIVKSGATVAAGTHKQLSLATVQALYEDRVLTRDAALAELEKVGWDGPDADLLLQLADAKVEKKYRDAGTAQVRSAYVAYHLNDAQTIAALDTLNVSPGERDHLLTLWKIEQKAHARRLSVGQLNSAFKKGVIQEAEFTQRVRQLGYNARDAEILAGIDIPPLDIFTPVAPTTVPPTQPEPFPTLPSGSGDEFE